MSEHNLSQAGEPATTPHHCQPRPPQRILVADDDPSICNFSAQILIRHGYEVNAVADGAAAWEALNAGSYDLLITDNNMPKVSGIELLKKLRAARIPLPVILASGALPTREFARFPWLQPDAMLLKPYVIAQLLETVKVVLRATDGAREQITPPPDWEHRPSAEVYRHDDYSSRSNSSVLDVPNGTARQHGQSLPRAWTGLGL